VIPPHAKSGIHILPSRPVTSRPEYVDFSDIFKSFVPAAAGYHHVAALLGRGLNDSLKSFGDDPFPLVLVLFFFLLSPRPAT